MVEKADLIAQLRDNHKATFDLITDLDPALVIHAESGWRLRDIIAHMAVWYGVRVRALRARQRGETFLVPGGDVQKYNLDTVAERAALPVEEVFAEWEREFAALIDILSAMEPEQFALEMTYPWNAAGPVSVFIERLIAHQGEHYEEIQAVV